MSCRFLRRLLALGCLSLCLCTVGVAEDRAAKAKREALEYLEVLAQPRVGLHALEKFESRLEVYPELADLVNDDVRRARAHKLRWEAHLQEIRSRRPMMRISYNPDEPTLRLPSGDFTVALQEQKLEARRKDGQLLWAVPWPEKEVKLLAYPARVIAIGRAKTLLLEAKSGQTLHTWPSKLEIDVLVKDKFPWVWDLFERPDLILGADSEHVYVGVLPWFCVLRQADADGWAYHTSRKIRVMHSSDGKSIIVQDYYGTIHCFRLRDQKTLWEHSYRLSDEIRLLDVSESKVFFYVPTLGKLVTISAKDGRPLSELNHFDF